MKAPPFFRRGFFYCIRRKAFYTPRKTGKISLMRKLPAAVLSFLLLALCGASFGMSDKPVDTSAKRPSRYKPLFSMLHLQPAKKDKGQVRTIFGMGKPTPRPAPSGEALPLFPHGQYTDLSLRFSQYFTIANGLFDSYKIADLRRYDYLFVPGLFSNTVVSPVRLGRTESDKGYFDAYIQLVENDLHAPAAIADIESEQIPSYNAPRVAAILRNFSRPVIIVTHSKGGIDTLAALLDNPDLWPKVRGVICIQTPFFGSQAADYITTGKYLYTAAGRLLRAMNGTEKTALELTTSLRISYYRQREKEINALLRAVPFVTFGSWKENEGPFVDTPYIVWRSVIAERGSPRSDGLVPLESTRLPGSFHAEASGFDHSCTVRPSHFLRCDRVRLFKTLLLLLPKKTSAEAAAKSPANGRAN